MPRRSLRNTVGVRELKTHAARILRHVREAGASYVLTHRGRAVGVILPVDRAAADSASVEGAEPGRSWEEFLRAGRRLEGQFQQGVSGVRILSQTRR